LITGSTLQGLPEELPGVLHSGRAVEQVRLAALVARLQRELVAAALARQALSERTSKAALIRRYVRERLRPLPSLEEDPLWRLVGMVEGDADDSARVDDVVYGRNSTG